MRLTGVRTRGYLLLFFAFLLSGCAAEAPETSAGLPETVGHMELQYADQFAVEYLADGCALVTVVGGGRFLVVPEGQALPQGLDEAITVLRQPIEDIYLAATSAMCLFDALDALPAVSMSGTKAEGWYVENARAAMERGEILYAGKYSAPDYELLLARNCALAIESTMIHHAPAVKEKLEALGIPVLVERSSYESHPLGRTEWIKLYGLLTGREARAQACFEEQVAYLEQVSAEESGKTVAFFYISSAGSAVTRKSGDYAVKMIELAGGQSVFSGLGDPERASGSVNLEMERFYSEAKEADFILYNSAVDGELHTIDELLAKSQLLSGFKAVQNGDVWCTSKHLFQETTEFGRMIAELSRILSGEATDDLIYYERLR